MAEPRRTSGVTLRGGLTEGALGEFAGELAGLLRSGDVIVLSGEVGAGKTTFVRFLATALGVREGITSPTYQLARSYEGDIGGRTVTVNHLDLYRIEDLDPRDALDFEDYVGPGSVTFVEWAEPALDLLEEPTVIELSHETTATRRVRVSGPVAERLSERA